jgi:hypothetical protein
MKELLLRDTINDTPATRRNRLTSIVQGAADEACAARGRMWHQPKAMPARVAQRVREMREQDPARYRHDTDAQLERAAEGQLRMEDRQAFIASSKAAKARLAETREFLDAAWAELRRPRPPAVSGTGTDALLAELRIANARASLAGLTPAERVARMELATAPEERFVLEELLDRDVRALREPDTLQRRIGNQPVSADRLAAEKQALGREVEAITQALEAAQLARIHPTDMETFAQARADVAAAVIDFRPAAQALTVLTHEAQVGLADAPESEQVA